MALCQVRRSGSPHGQPCSAPLELLQGLLHVAVLCCLHSFCENSLLLRCHGLLIEASGSVNIQDSPANDLQHRSRGHEHFHNRKCSMPTQYRRPSTSPDSPRYQPGRC